MAQRKPKAKPKAVEKDLSKCRGYVDIPADKVDAAHSFLERMNATEVLHPDGDESVVRFVGTHPDFSEIDSGADPKDYSKRVG